MYYISLYSSSSYRKVIQFYAIKLKGSYRKVICIPYAKVKGLMLGCNLDLNERKEYILYKMNKSCKKYEESQYDETVEVDVDQEDVYE